MSSADDYMSWLSGALSGDKACAEALAGRARDRLRVYVARITLDEHLTEDILQETMIEMFKFLDKLERPDRFWPWLFRMAGNNARDAVNRRRRQVSIEQAGPSADGNARGGLEQLISAELQRTVSAAMAALRPEHRQVISLRCYEQLPYSEIAAVLGKSEFASRMLFMRAKKCLARQLARRGLGGTALLLALGLFGRMTARTEAAAAKVSVTPAALQVGWGPTLVGALTSKTALVATLAAVVAGGAAVTGPLRGDRGDCAEAPVQAPAVQREYAAADQAWYFLPKGPSGPLMLRLNDYRCWCGDRCGWLRNEQGNYHYHKGRRAAVIENYCFLNPDGSVLRLPTDDPGFLAFLEKMDGVAAGATPLDDRGDNMLIISRRGRDGRHVRSVRHYNALMEGSFRSNWPADTVILDHRDEMHHRGWTFFTIHGDLNGRRIVGRGRIPFVFAQAHSAYPWLRLEVGDDLRIEDSPTGACVLDASGQVAERFPAGHFFTGMGRPWMGFHAIDAIRRDAASLRIPFETDYETGRPLGQVTLDDGAVRLVYTIDMQNDVLREVAFMLSDGRILGRLSLSYLDRAEPSMPGFAPPPDHGSRASQPRDGNGPHWLLELAPAFTSGASPPQ